MTDQPTARPPAHPRRSPEWLLAVGLTALVVLLHLFFLNRVGGLWRDEINSLNIALGNWARITSDSFPILFPLLLRGWSGLGLGGSDLGLRCFGILTGLSLTAAFWLAAWWSCRRPPVWSLVLVALNAWVIYYDASLRAYGLGSALAVLCAGAAWRFLRQPGWKSWLLFTTLAILSVQTLYQNTAMVAAVCAGAGSVCLRQKKPRLFAGLFLGGLVAAVSLLACWQNIAGITQSTVVVRSDFNLTSALSNLDTMLAFPLPQFSWVWLGLAGLVVVKAVAGIFQSSRDDHSLFAAVTIASGCLAYFIFLRQANFTVQPWHFLPLLALTAVAFENSLPRPAGKFRASLWGGLLATALISGLFGLRVLDYRFTNVDGLAKKVSDAAHENDYAVVKSWPYGLTFGHNFNGTCAWDTVPPLADHRTHRYDLFAEQMQNPEAMTPVLARAENVLRTGHAVWVVGHIARMNPTNDLVPVDGDAWNEMVGYGANMKLDGFLRRHAAAIECIDLGTNENVNFNERCPLFKATGWK